jgi:hypothetical protein
MGIWGESAHVGRSLPALRPKAGRVYPPPEGYKRQKLREMDRDKQSSKHAFGAWSDPTNKIMGGSLAVHRSVILVQLPDDSSLEGNGNSNCCSRFSSSSSLLVLALRLIAVSGALLAQLSYAAHAATPAVRPR